MNDYYKLNEKKGLLRQESINKHQDVILYIKNLTDIIDDEQLLKKISSKFGIIMSAKVNLYRSSIVLQLSFVFLCLSHVGK